MGKTSLVRRLVTGSFDETYQTTVGVQVKKTTVDLAGETVGLMLWDIAGEDKFFRVPDAYFRGSSGYLLVMDGTRKVTVDQALELHERVHKVIGEIPIVVALNKFDLEDDWDIEDSLTPVVEKGWPVFRTSAKTGDAVSEAFHELVRAMVAH